MWDIAQRMNVDEYLDELASPSPTPGGGSACAFVGANGAALVSMVARITLRSQKFSAVHAQATIFAKRADELRHELRAAGTADEQAYGAVRTALAMPKDTEEEKALRAERRDAALAVAAEAPLHIAELAAQVATLSEAALSLGNQMLESDLVCAVEFSLAAANAASANVLINHRSMKDDELIAAQRERLWKACAATDQACETVRKSFVAIAAG
jgi:formiminotetrahydrofolate cyclodeaminase